MKKIYRDDLVKVIDKLTTDIYSNVSLTKLEKETVYIIVDEHLDNLCGNPEYRSHN